MKVKDQVEIFEIGSVSLFAGLIFFTVFPVVIKMSLFFVNAIIYKLLGVFFIGITLICYFFCPVFYKKQLIMIGISFILFSIFQFIFGIDATKIIQAGKYIFFLSGTVLLFKGLN